MGFINIHPPEHVTRWFKDQPPVKGFWGEPTASLDWCEANYEISHYVAEFANTFSNFVFIFLALFGVRKAYKSGMPAKLVLMPVGVGLVGIGSFFFHATLSYAWQLGDELPMVWTAAQVLYVSLTTPSGPSSTSKSKTESNVNFWIGTGITAYVLLFMALYLHWPNPVFHQSAYALIQLSTTVRVTYLCFHNPIASPVAPGETASGKIIIGDEKELATLKTLQRWGASIFTMGFLIWNLDNIFCDQITQWKKQLGGFPSSMLVEGHAWWHIFTGYGAYLIVVGIQYLVLVINANNDPSALKAARKVASSSTSNSSSQTPLFLLSPYRLEWFAFGLMPYVVPREGWGGESTLKGVTANGNGVLNGEPLANGHAKGKIE